MDWRWRAPKRISGVLFGTRRLQFHHPGRAAFSDSGIAWASTTAAFANGAFSQALEFDDTHNESIVHMSSPAVAAALALSEFTAVSGRDLITAVAIGNEVSCRVGSVSSGELHRRGFHPTGLFATFGVAYLAGKLLGLDVETLARAAGHRRELRIGVARMLGGRNPDQVPASRMVGAKRDHGGAARALRRHRPGTSLRRTLGTLRIARAGSERASRLCADRCGARRALGEPQFVVQAVSGGARDPSVYQRACCGSGRSTGYGRPVERIECPVTEFIVGIVCEPTAEKFAPASDSHGRVSLAYSLAEALYHGALGKSAYSAESLKNPEILALAGRVHYYVDPAYPGPGRFKGAARIVLKDGRAFEEVEEYNRGSAENPMTDEELRAKFDDNASGFLSPEQRDRLALEIDGLENLPNATRLLHACG